MNNAHDQINSSAIKVADGELSSANPAWLRLVAEKVQNLQYGVIQIVVHDSRVVQVERTERHRFDVQRSA